MTNTLTITRPDRLLILLLPLLCLVALADYAQASPNPAESILPSGRVASVAALGQLLSADEEHTCALRTDGTLACWGGQ